MEALKARENRQKPAGNGTWLTMGMVLMLMALQPAGRADTPPDDLAAFARRAGTIYRTAKARLEAETNSAEAQWQFGRACFDWADCATANSERAKIAEEGIAACRTLTNSDPQSVPGHYYLGMNLAELAQTKTLGALKIVDEMEQEFKLTLGLDASYDHAGADRNLGLIYRDAPGWPASIGSKSKARQHLRQAVKLGPEDPENLLNLIEAELKWRDHEGVTRDLKALDELWPAAQKQFTGEEWASSWADWTKRRDEARKKSAANVK